jgi:hypothetical protein
MPPTLRSSGKFLGVVPRAEAEKFLVDWANLERDEFPRFMRRYSNFFGETFDLHDDMLLMHRDWLRKAWEQQSPFKRNWHLARIRLSFPFCSQIIQRGIDPQTADAATLRPLIEPPDKPTPVDAALFYLEYVIADRAKCCGNTDDCERPYFVASKRWQRYCSDSCARPATLAAKRKWWNEKGREANR